MTKRALNAGQRAAKAKRAHDAAEIALVAIVDLDRDRTLPKATVDAVYAAVNACREVRREADFEALVIAEAEGGEG